MGQLGRRGDSGLGLESPYLPPRFQVEIPQGPSLVAEIESALVDEGGGLYLHAGVESPTLLARLEIDRVEDAGHGTDENRLRHDGRGRLEAVFVEEGPCWGQLQRQLVGCPSTELGIGSEAGPTGGIGISSHRGQHEDRSHQETGGYQKYSRRRLHRP